MKNSTSCIKCNSPKVIKIGGGNKWKGFHAAFQIGGMNVVTMDRFICVSCGYTELWIEKDEDLKKLENRFDQKDLDEYV